KRCFANALADTKTPHLILPNRTQTHPPSDNCTVDKNVNNYKRQNLHFKLLQVILDNNCQSK
ncbi:MAG: hypothetical protein ACOVOQ_03290, partial [Flavobacterium sp.]